MTNYTTPGARSTGTALTYGRRAADAPSRPESVALGRALPNEPEEARIIKDLAL